jgi:4-oxalocrotonate tautomerase
MPIVNIQLVEGRTVDQKAKLADKITKAIIEVTGVKPDSIEVIFTEYSKDNIARGGILFSHIHKL